MSSLQEREVQRYYQPWLAAHGSSLNVAKHVDSIAQTDLQQQGYQPKTSRDKAITAFAQLVALRLDVRRCMVSLIDAANQYILAEATRSHSATKDVGKDGDELWLGSAILTRADAVCEHCMINTCSAPEEDGRLYHTKGLIISDCRLDDRFKDRSYVVAEPGVRFYAGVPLYSRNGYMIGAIAVSDDQPRAGLVADQLRLMQETAQNVMEHLEWARDRVDRFKGERIVRGMASFIEDCSSLRDGPQREDLDEDKTKSQTTPERAPRSRPVSQHLSRPPLVSRNSGRKLAAGAQKASGRGDGMSRMFATAAEILRESTLADGCAVIGATADSGRTPNIRATPHNLDGVTEKNAGTVYGQPSPSSDSGGHDTNTSDSDSSPAARPCKILSFAVADEQARAGIETGTALTLATLEKYFSLYPHGKTFSFTQDGAGIFSEEESDSVASATEAEPSPNSGNEGRNSTSRARARKRRMDHKALLKKIPGAKTVIFLPLYDHSEEKLIAGTFLWTSVTGRMLQDADLSYLRAFGNCIVSEVIRMNMQRNEAAKTTFIASMSHELRSPLHGILGAAEFLMDTATDSYQSGLVTSIVTCGRTLLETLNHVLDYSKINKLGRTQMRRRAKQNKPINLASDSSLESLNLTADVDLGVLVEEVAEAVTAGHTFKRLPESASLSNAQQNGSTGEPEDTLTGQEGEPGQIPGHVIVLLDISPRRSWFVRIQPGALRRIIMNLLGNALKYTHTGFVAISLRAQESTDHSTTKALIRVVDSGKGMSESFQRDRMFVPFSQEDPFQPGTGLGLSIVKQIVDSLGGHVEVKSEQGVGTEIDVHLRLTPATGQSRPTSSRKNAGNRASDDSGDEPVIFDQEMVDIEKRTRGRHLVLLDPFDAPHARSPTSPTARLNQTLREIATSWFGMKVSQSREMNVEDADVYIFCEPPPVERLRDENRKTEKRQAQGKSKRDEREVAIIIVCMNDQEAVNMTRNHQALLRELGRIVEVIPQPCGPRKLAKVFTHCLRRAEEVRQGREVGGEDIQVSSTIDQDGQVSQNDPVQQKDKGTGITQQAGVKHPRHMDDLRKSVSAAVSYPTPPPFDPETPSLESPSEQRDKELHGPKDEEATPKAIVLNDKNPLEPAGRAPHLLLVDDNKINRQLLVMFMKRCNFTYREAENGQEALDVYQDSAERAISDEPFISQDDEHAGDAEHSASQARKGSNSSALTTISSRSRPSPFDFVLMDISMPIMDGMEATRRIREFEKEQGLKKSTVIALTGLASEKAREEAETVGIDVFLPKPVKFKELKTLLEMTTRGEVEASVA
ncbi:Putative signal transduction response regulator, receiver domain, histidine kinase/HSP90-like ATPase [Septoria linicola]|uniref:Signal transduction response regulator, receiver domain, histidine kinase/HSP90-like ATPase n=1 Tax=Septoria linicola TaxID=215465 RepID=A0A9Q9B0Z1_9PEZI|nr:putative signal transduction response regulator, receiver domain, histidine kinase/HSP90-like ATPase [Septoria linicola]USW58899.1 Putative signal transduction response regulator, receiver domain, histidine kinase/HSP90-like ATPase [Septoria linicola]